MKYVYGEGVRYRSHRHPEIISGQSPQMSATIVREAWIPWRYWSHRLLTAFFHAVARRVPPLRAMIEEVWCHRWEWKIEPLERTTIPISWDQTTPSNRARHQEWIDDREARAAHPRPNG